MLWPKQDKKLECLVVPFKQGRTSRKGGMKKCLEKTRITAHNIKLRTTILFIDLHIIKAVGFIKRLLCQ
ncbi:hypothetical protein P8452_20186 [Trifolium repens]|nr:hypothetical protein P8452_20186 [Trifolium repens]